MPGFEEREGRSRPASPNPLRGVRRPPSAREKVEATELNRNIRIEGLQVIAPTSRQCSRANSPEDELVYCPHCARPVRGQREPSGKQESEQFMQDFLTIAKAPGCSSPEWGAQDRPLSSASGFESRATSAMSPPGFDPWLLDSQRTTQTPGMAHTPDVGMFEGASRHHLGMRAKRPSLQAQLPEGLDEESSPSGRGWERQYSPESEHGGGPPRGGMHQSAQVRSAGRKVPLAPDARRRPRACGSPRVEEHSSGSAAEDEHRLRSGMRSSEAQTQVSFEASLPQKWAVLRIAPSSLKEETAMARTKRDLVIWCVNFLESVWPNLLTKGAAQEVVRMYSLEQEASAVAPPGYGRSPPRHARTEDSRLDAELALASLESRFNMTTSRTSTNSRTSVPGRFSIQARQRHTAALPRLKQRASLQDEAAADLLAGGFRTLREGGAGDETPASQGSAQELPAAAEVADAASFGITTVLKKPLRYRPSLESHGVGKTSVGSPWGGQRSITPSGRWRASVAQGGVSHRGAATIVQGGQPQNRTVVEAQEEPIDMSVSGGQPSFFPPSTCRGIADGASTPQSRDLHSSCGGSVTLPG